MRLLSAAGFLGVSCVICSINEPGRSQGWLEMVCQVASAETLSIICL